MRKSLCKLARFLQHPSKVASAEVSTVISTLSEEDVLMKEGGEMERGGGEENKVFNDMS